MLELQGEVRALRQAIEAHNSKQEKGQIPSGQSDDGWIESNPVGGVKP